jgi:hypothetical protein
MTRGVSICHARLRYQAHALGMIHKSRPYRFNFRLPKSHSYLPESLSLLATKNNPHNILSRQTLQPNAHNDSPSNTVSFLRKIKDVSDTPLCLNSS